MRRMRHTKKFLSGAVLAVTIGCGGGGSDSDASGQARNLSGTYSGTADVKVDRGGEICTFFAGQYPIQWQLVEAAPATYSILDGGFEIASGISDRSSPQTITIAFPEVQNFPPGASSACNGSETVRLVEDENGGIRWIYKGHASCGQEGDCDYSGQALLQSAS